MLLLKIVCRLTLFAYLVIGMLICFQSLLFRKKIKIRNTWRHQSAKSVGSRPGPAESKSGLIEADLGPNCLQRLSAEYKSV